MYEETHPLILIKSKFLELQFPAIYMPPQEFARVLSTITLVSHISFRL
jgi:hypothetical protein